MLIKKSFFLKNFFKLLLGVAIYLCLSLPEKITFESGEKKIAIEFFSLVVLAVFIGLSVGFNSEIVNAKRIFVSMTGAIIGGILLGILQAINFRSIEVMLFFIPAFSIAIVLGIYYNSFLKIVLGTIGAFIASLISIVLLAIGTLFSRGWWGPAPFPKLGDLPLLLSCVVIGWVLIAGIGIEDYLCKSRLKKYLPAANFYTRRPISIPIYK